MINIQKVREVFKDYVANYNNEDGKIKLKIEHILRVAELSKKIAISLNLDDENIYLAETIGIFHDIGRFEQVKRYDTFNDKISENHALMGIKVLFEENLIEKFDIDKKYYPVIKIAILNHNKDKIDDGLTKIEKLHSRIIRDADKLDIFYNICNYDFESVFWYKEFDCHKINEVLLDDLKNYRHVNYSIVQNNADIIPTFYAFIYDLNFEFSLNYLKDKKYLEMFAQRVNKHFTSDIVKEQMHHIIDWYNSFLFQNISHAK